MMDVERWFFYGQKNFPAETPEQAGQNTLVVGTGRPPTDSDFLLRVSCPRHRKPSPPPPLADSRKSGWTTGGLPWSIPGTPSPGLVGHPGGAEERPSGGPEVLYRPTVHDGRLPGRQPLPLICSSYHTWADQEALFQNQVEQYLPQGCSFQEAREEATALAAVPGTSEHQLGQAVGIVDLSYQVLDCGQENTDVQKWFIEHC